MLANSSVSPSTLSLPVWEEWIEILILFASSLLTLSLPVWEEWIEIFIL